MVQPSHARAAPRDTLVMILTREHVDNRSSRVIDKCIVSLILMIEQKFYFSRGQVGQIPFFVGIWSLLKFFCGILVIFGGRKGVCSVVGGGKPKCGYKVLVALALDFTTVIVWSTAYATHSSHF